MARRKLAEELLALTSAYVQVLATRGYALTWNDSYPDRSAYRSAMYRLRKAGLIAYVVDGQHQVLRLTDVGTGELPAYYRPESRWKARWTGIWYVLMYDVPEEHRKNRDELRRFLQRMDMGCLQKSIWVTPRDIRPEYHDLQKAACISDYAVLFEASNVLGYPDWEIARRAWGFDRLREAQAAYCLTSREQLERLKKGGLSRSHLEQLGREEMQAFAAVMRDDPLLPSALLPPNYRGKEAYQFHRRFVRAMRSALARSHSPVLRSSPRRKA